MMTVSFVTRTNSYLSGYKEGVIKSGSCLRLWRDPWSQSPRAEVLLRVFCIHLCRKFVWGLVCVRLQDSHFHPYVGRQDIIHKQ